MRRLRLLVAFALRGRACAGGDSRRRRARPARRRIGKNIVQTAVAAGDFDTLVSLVKQAGLADTLAHGGPFTVFAPTDEAFANVPKATLDALAADPALLKQVLLYHVVGRTRLRRARRPS